MQRINMIYPKVINKLTMEVFIPQGFRCCEQEGRTKTLFSLLNLQINV